MKIMIEVKDKKLTMKKCDNMSREIYIILKQYGLNPTRIWVGK